MSQAHFFREKIVDACLTCLNDIYRLRMARVQEAEANLAAFDKKVDDRSWWQRTSACDLNDRWNRAHLEEKINTEKVWADHRKKRVECIYDFCNVLADDTVAISAQEFKDFSDFYKG